MSINSGSKAKENHESWENLFKRTLSKDRLFTFTRPAESPIHWIQLLDPFDQHDTRKICKSTVTHSDLAGNEGSPKSGQLSGDKLLQSKLPEAVAALAQAAVKVSGESRAGGPVDMPGWPLIPFSKVQMFKCEKCCLEFCSPINHRRHLRTIHRRTSHSEKEDFKSQRQQLATFWDKLSPEEAYKIAAVKNLQVEDLPGDKVARALRHLLRQPNLFVLPHSYVKAGAMLLELVQSRSARLFLTSSELFKILDGSSEKTFPSFGLNAMQRYIFEGGAGKVGLETKNLVASLSFLVEQNLVKAFIKDKDVEAWRCQTALVEEEEASRKKQAQMRARKEMKKIRQKDKEQKASALATQHLSDIDSSDDELSSVSHPAGPQMRPSSNTFENLNHQLAGEGIDSDNCLEVVPIATSHPCDRSLALVDSSDEVISTAVSTFCEKSLVTVDSSDKAVSTAPSSSHEKIFVQGDSNNVASVANGVGIVSMVLEGETKNTSNLPGTNEVSPSDASGAQEPYTLQKCKHHVERSLAVRGVASIFPYQKQSWKERSLSARNSVHRTSAKDAEEDMGLSSCTLRAVVQDTSANKVVGFRPRQHVAKPLQSRNYPVAAQMGGGVWTKKMPKKYSDASSLKAPHHTELPTNDTSPDVSDSVLPNETCQDCSDSVLQAEGSFDSSLGLSSNGTPYDRKSCSLFIPSTTVCPNLEPSLSSACSKDSVNVSTIETGFSNQERSQKPLSVVDSGHFYQGNHHSASSASVVVGSLVIGSLSVSLDSVVGPKDSAQTVSSCKDVTQESKVLDVSERELAELADPTERPKETNAALQENGANKCASQRDCKGDGRLLKILSQSDGEWKENKEHSICLPGLANLAKPTAVQGGSCAGLKMKVWRPVVSNTCHDCCVEKPSAVVVDGSDCVNKVSSNSPHLIGGDINDLCEKLEVGQATQKGGSSKVGVKSVADSSTAFQSGCTSTFRAVASFLSQRWSDALHNPDSVILSIEAEEGLARHRNDDDNPDQSKSGSEFSPGSRNSSPQSNRRTNNLSRSVTKSGGLWKQGCSGSAMAGNRRMMGKDSLHFTPRYTGYKYVPK